MKTLFKIICRILTVLVVLAAVAALVGKFWIFPDVICDSVRTGIGDYWDGKVEIRRVDFAYTGPLDIRGLKLIDRDGNVWMEIDNITATLSNWPISITGLGGSDKSTVLTGLKVERPVVRARFVDGRCDVPLKQFPPETGNMLDKYVDLESLEIRDAKVACVDRFGESMELEDGTFIIKSRGQKLHAIIGGSGAGVAFRLYGSAAPYKDAYKLSDWSFEGPRGKLSEDLFAIAAVRRDNLGLVLNKIRGGFCGGWIDGRLTLEVDMESGIRYSGNFSGDGVKIAEFAKKVAIKNPPTRGTLEGRAHFTGQNADLNALAGWGWVFMDDSDASNFALVGDVWKFTGLGEPKALRRSDVLARFKLKGPVVIIQKARLTNPLAAFDIQPGGRIDLYNRRIDMYVVAAAISKTRGVLDLLPIPFIRPTTSFTEKLMRLRIKGHWSEPLAKLIHKEPLKDLQEGLADFLRQSAESGGQITSGVVTPLRKLFDPPATQPKDRDE